MGKFDEKKDEFYKWSQTIHDEVGSVMKKILIISLIKAMVNIPMKVGTKTVAFTDSTAVANARLAGETSIVAFRATTSKNGHTGNASYSGSKPGICFFSSSNSFVYPSGMGKC